MKKRSDSQLSKKKLEAIRNSPYFLKKDEEVAKELATKEFREFLKKDSIKGKK